MPNLLVFQQLVTMYLGGILVRVVSEMCEEMLKSVEVKTKIHDWFSQ